MRAQREKMAITAIPKENGADDEAPLLNDVVAGAADYKGRPAGRSTSGCWKSASFLIGVEVAERFAYYGISSNMMSYLTGPLGQSTAAAAANINAWNGTTRLLPLVGAFVADSILGRFRTIVVSFVVYVVGLAFMSMSAAFHSSYSSRCRSNQGNSACSPPTLELVVFFTSFYLVALAQGGKKPCVLAFGADQFDEEDENEVLAKSSFFNWWYFAMTIGGLPSLTVLSYVQENISWELGFGIPCILMCLAFALFLLGSTTYRYPIISSRDDRNPFLRIARVFARAVRNRNAASTTGDVKLKFLDNAIIAPPGADGSICTAEDVDDARGILRLVPISCACLGYAIIFSQISTLFTKQASTLDRHLISTDFEIPAASLQSLVTVSALAFVAIYDRILVPKVRAVTKKPTGISMLQRIGTGIFLSILIMVIAALVERQRLVIATNNGLINNPTETVPMNVWWLAPQYVLLGIADVFTMAGLQEFFYDQVPNELRSFGLALFLCIFGIGSFLSSFLISVIEVITSRAGCDSWFSDNLNQSHLDYFYWLLGGLGVLTFVFYVYYAKCYTYKRKD